MGQLNEISLIWSLIWFIHVFSYLWWYHMVGLRLNIVNVRGLVSTSSEFSYTEQTHVHILCTCMYLQSFIDGILIRIFSISEFQKSLLPVNKFFLKETSFKPIFVQSYPDLCIEWDCKCSSSVYRKKLTMHPPQSLARGYRPHLHMRLQKWSTCIICFYWMNRWVFLLQSLSRYCIIRTGLSITRSDITQYTQSKSMTNLGCVRLWSRLYGDLRGVCCIFEKLDRVVMGPDYTCVINIIINFVLQIGGKWLDARYSDVASASISDYMFNSLLRKTTNKAQIYSFPS